jgi:hypothetical protein
VEGPNDELIGVVVSAVRRAHSNGHDALWETLLGHEEQIRAWLGGPEKLRSDGAPVRGRALRLRGA